MDPNDLLNPLHPFSPISPMNPASPVWAGNGDTQNATSATDGEGAIIAVCLLGSIIVYFVALYVYDWWNGKIF